MFEGISKNWGYLTTIGAIVAVAFGAGIWLKNTLDTLETLPGKFDSFDGRLTPLEAIPKTIEKATCALEAQTGMSKNEVLKYIIDIKIEEVNEKVFSLDNMDGDWTNKEKRKHERLRKRAQDLVRQRNEFKMKYEQQLAIYGSCK